MVAGKARRLGKDTGLSQKRNKFSLYALGRQNDSQVGAEQFSSQEGFTPINQTGLQDTSKALGDGSQFGGAIGFKFRLCSLDSDTSELDITKASASGDVFDTAPGDCNALIIGSGGGTMTSDLEFINFPEWQGHRLTVFLNDAQTVTVKHTAGTTIYAIKTPTEADVVFSGAEQTISFVWSVTLSQWILVSQASGGGGCPVICAENDMGDISGNVDIDWSLANFHRARLIGDVVFTLINLPDDPLWQDICVEVLQDPVGGHAVAFTNGFNNGFIANPAQGINRYTSWQFYTYENPALTKIIQGFEKPSGTALAGNEWDGFAGFVHAKLSANQTTDITVGDHIEFDTVVNNDKLTVTSPAPGQFAGIFSGFTRGHTYECECYLAGQGSGNTLNFGAQFFDRTAGVFLGTEGTNLAETGGANRDSQTVAKALFNAVSASDSLEVRITNDTVLSAILEGQATPSDGTCMVTIKDCGITEDAQSNAPGIDPDLEQAILEDDIEAVPLPFDPNENPVFGEIDLAEMWHQAHNPGTSGDRFMQLNTTGSATTEANQQTDMIRSGRVMQIHVNKIQSGGGVRELSFRKNGADVLTMFFSVGTGIQVTTNNINVPWKAGDLVNWRMSGGIGGSERWIATMLVWYL
ncbi:hypothetical protein LCGC14_0870730 [marine sediment metagenome]|uniref:Uncharacterized protein n=1 Tax=marine sediment metagenome TaxID=412755 RepID=A0A0F9RPI6_9ZZZZ